MTGAVATNISQNCLPRKKEMKKTSTVRRTKNTLVFLRERVQCILHVHLLNGDELLAEREIR